MKKNKPKVQDASKDKDTTSAVDVALAAEVVAYASLVTFPTYFYIAETVGMGVIFGAPAALVLTAPFLSNLDKLDDVNKVLADTYDYLMYGNQE